jgi:Na+/H+ antiporter NhaC
LVFLLGQFSIAKSLEVTVPGVVVSDVECELVISGDSSMWTVSNWQINGISGQPERRNGKLHFTYTPQNREKVVIAGGEFSGEITLNPIPLWISVLPPLVAIILALLLKEVITSLLLGVLSGTLVMGIYSQGWAGILPGFLSAMDTYIMHSLDDSSHISVILFSIMIAGIVSIISKNGGMLGIVQLLEPYAKNAKSGQLVIWLMGLIIFFDDYANTLVVGNTMRPVADKLKISRQKLAYLVDSTAAPVASLAFITTWIGAELGYIESGLNHIPGIQESAYSVFLNSLAFAFYPILTLAFMLILIFRARDFGPMYHAEITSRKSDISEGKEHEVETEFEAKEGIEPRAFNAVIPIFVVIVGTIVGMWYTGVNATEAGTLDSVGFLRKLSIIIGNSDSFISLVWASFAGVVMALILTVSQKLLTLEETVQSGMGGFKSMIPAMIILILAWSLAGITEDLHTAQFLQGLWSPAISPVFIPAVVFVLSALVSFSTGSSWGTMAILYPLLLPASYTIAVEAGMSHDEAMLIFYNVVSVILAGSVFGDHCSPISDTTILSSLATSCNHIEHVKTQMPYALTVGAVAILFGSIPAAMGVSSWFTFPVGIAVLWGIVHVWGSPTDEK